MSFGWSPSDIVSLARLCYDVYSFCRIAPAELQGLLTKVDEIGQKLERLSSILEKSGLGQWKQASALEQHLLNARAYLEPLRPITEKDASTPSKAKVLARLALDQRKLSRIEKDLDLDRQLIDDMKIDLILVCSLRNLQCGAIFPQTPAAPFSGHVLPEKDACCSKKIRPTHIITSGSPLGLEDDRSVVASITVSNASKALELARELGSQKRSKPDFHTFTNGALQNTLRDVRANDFICDVASLAEETELYSQNANPTQSLEQLHEISERATSFRLSLHSPIPEPKLNKTRCLLPGFGGPRSESFERNIFGHLSSMSDSATMRIWASDLTQESHLDKSSAPKMNLPKPSSSFSSRTPSQLSVRPSEDGEKFSQADTMSTVDSMKDSDGRSSAQDPISLQGRSSVKIATAPKVSMDCSFALETYEGSVRLRADSIGRPRYAVHSRILSQILRHCFQPQDRPIPHLLHPDVEGPMSVANTPYTVTFTSPQYVSIEGASERPRWTTSLEYIFSNKQDQIQLCEKIFNKSLLLTAGTNKIVLDGQETSHMSAITLWYDAEPGTYSITYFRSLTGKKATPKDIELRVHGSWDAKSVSRNSTSLAVVAEPMLADDSASDTSVKFERQPTFSSSKSGGTLLNRVSTASSWRRRKPEQKKCVIEFTRLGDKISFLDHIK
ncbi:MAG: hypothetical protein Q9227_009065 [Pyrenula ochraceoflavens]